MANEREGKLEAQLRHLRTVHGVDNRQYLIQELAEITWIDGTKTASYVAGMTKKRDIIIWSSTANGKNIGSPFEHGSGGLCADSTSRIRRYETIRRYR